MTRFNIQEIVYQEPDGVFYFAVDADTQQPVELRRFFPFGRYFDEDQKMIEAKGIEPQQVSAFSTACERLSSVNHPALRRTIFGSADPIDGIPYIVTEWIEGASLSSILGDNTMKSSLVLPLLRQALEVCEVLSNTLGNEAVWIDTKLDSIIVSDFSENPSFLFRICPFKCLDAPSHAKDMTSIVRLVETLTGWKTKHVGNSAGHGLGKWLKLMSLSPQTGMLRALESLPDPSNTRRKAGKAARRQPSTSTDTDQPRSRKKIIAIMALVACLTAVPIYFVHRQVRNHDQPVAAAKDKSDSPPHHPTSVKIDAENDLKRERQEFAQKTPVIDQQDKLTNTQAPEPVKPLTDIPVFSPDDTQLMAKIPIDQPAMLKAVIKSVIISKNSYSIYFVFSEPWNRKEVGVIIDPRRFEGGPHNREQMLQNLQNFRTLIGKTVTFEGTVWRYNGRPEPHFIRVNYRNQIKVDE
jgi:serine/threonine protein kinase